LGDATLRSKVEQFQKDQTDQVMAQSEWEEDRI
jgi:hypothetical protein